MNPYVLLRSREIYRNPWIHVREDELRRPDGQSALFGIVDMKPGSSVLALNEEREVYLVREFKYAVGRESLEVISGGIESGEEPLGAARRELREEAGLDAAQWIPMGRIDPFTTVISSANYLFLALDVRQAPHQPDPSEVLRVERVPLDEAVRLVSAGEITHGASVALLLKADRYFCGPTPGRR